jgi:predicted metal-dependent HD superfamily phosphohydrolase
MNLKEKFVNVLEEIGFEANKTDALWQDLEKAYSGKNRYYHNLTHLEEMIVQYEKYQSELTFPVEVLYAIFYHDYIYKATSKENELKSAEFAISILPENAKINTALVFDIIVATKLHEHNNVEDTNWLIDFDLKILSKEWKEYEVYFKQIRKEYKIYPDLLYNPGRKKALQHFLENEFIFQTETFRTQFEKQARENILKEIQIL